jgi:hypothetical protein
MKTPYELDPPSRGRDNWSPKKIRCRCGNCEHTWDEYVPIVGKIDFGGGRYWSMIDPLHIYVCPDCESDEVYHG